MSYPIDGVAAMFPRLFAGLLVALCMGVDQPQAPPSRPDGLPPRPSAADKTGVRERRRGLDMNRHVVYVHGICMHKPGYSKDWWDALKGYVKEVVPDANHHEVLWSDAVIPKERPRSVPAAQREKGARIIDALKDRAVRQRVHAGGDERGVIQEKIRGTEGDVPGENCVDDMTTYLQDMSARQAVIGRFTSVVRPLLSQGAQVEVICHSWGTVIAYEAICGMDGAIDQLPGRVHNLIMVGSALSIPEVKRSLLPVALDGHRPKLVLHWVNLNARFDVVGGNLKGNPFQVDEEYLNLAAVGCSAFIPDPFCAHTSYFQRDNLAVNRDILGRLIDN
jgi:hypothetical protein